ncbi:glycosyltransferase family 29 protein [Microbacterium sp. JZ31]|uniref:glycosyltransferase family 29 protein n=1 Tax=Microbacterium sp. JZ31 TaxID=1906274 RepID=UPI0019321C41|nr:glycosyltransferase family 29 protein [Microbacterium sp. JZ31]
MKLLKRLKRIPLTRALIARVKKTRTGRSMVRRVRVLLGIDPRVPGRRLWADPLVVDTHDVAPHRVEEFHIWRAEWRDQGATPRLVEQARSLSRNSIAWVELHPSAWLVFCAVLLESGDRETAEHVLRTYAAKYGIDGIADVLPVASFAREIGVRSARVDQAAAIDDVLIENLATDPLARLVAGKSVAVVGNGPGNVGTGRGVEIDAHDVVIRFNNFPDTFAADYGSRTDVWVRGAHGDVRDRYDLERFDLVLWEMDFLHNVVERPEHRDILYRDTLFSPAKVSFIGAETKRSLREASGLMLPTSGAQVIWALRQARGNLDGVDVYGFSSLDGSEEYGHYFDSLGDMEKRHDVAGERAFLRGLLAPDAKDAEAAQLRRIVFNCAYREYDPSRGRTGGPAGVLATQRLALGDALGDDELRYVFDDGDKEEMRAQLAPRLRGVRGKIADIILGGEHIRTHPDILAARDAGRQVLLVCHELGSAFGAYQLGLPYVIVYHQQGSTLQEMRSIGQEPSAHEITVANRLEEIICGNAEKMYFPSIGARETFRATAHPRVVEVTTFAESALYNTVSAVDHNAHPAAAQALGAELRRKLNLPEKDARTDVFLSVGDWNEDKGLDRVPALLQRHAEASGRKVVWVGIGSAMSRALFDQVKSQQSSWRFDARLVGERMTHDRLLALLDYADYYVMMHRNSIFDLATLEAMRAGKALILSPVGGNPEVNLDDNVAFVSEETLDDAAAELGRRDRRGWGERNRLVFEEHFSLEHFAERYRRMLEEQIDRFAGEPRS